MNNIKDLENLADTFLERIKTLDAIEDLQHTRCQLRHSDTEVELPYAVEYLCIPMGFHSQHSDTLQIAACTECMEYLSSGEWVLFLCVNCLASRWRYTKSAKLDYAGKTIVLMEGCPECGKSLSKVYLI